MTDPTRTDYDRWMWLASGDRYGNDSTPTLKVALKEATRCCQELEESLKLCRQQALFLFDAGKNQGDEIRDLKRQLRLNQQGLNQIANPKAKGWGSEPDDGGYDLSLVEPDDGGSGKL